MQTPDTGQIQDHEYSYTTSDVANTAISDLSFENKQLARRKYLGSTPYKTIMKHIVFPSFVGMIVQAMYTTIDSMYISNYSSQAIAAMSFVFPFETILIGVAVMNAVGSNSNISASLGSGNIKLASNFISACFFNALVIGIVLPIVLCTSLPYLLDIIGVTPETKPLALIYSYIICGAGSVSYALSMAACDCLRAEGKYKRSLMALACGAITNIVLDPIFIYAFKMGLAGAAISTVISNFVCASIGWSYFFVRNPAKRSVVILSWKKVFRPDFRCILKILSIGTSSLLSNVTLAIANVVINMLNSKFAASSWEAEAYAGSLGALNKILQLFIFTCYAFNQGTIALGSYAVGANLFARYRALAKLAAIWEISVMIGCAIALCALATVLPLIFYSGEREVAKIMTSMIYTCAPSQIFNGIQIFLFAAFICVKKPIASGFSASFRTCTVLVPVALTLAYTLKQPKYIMLAYPISDFISFLLCIGMITFNRKSLHIKKTDFDGPLNEVFEENKVPEIEL